MGTLVNGIKEIFATSQTTATHLPVCASDGTPQGRISVGDLASVLGESFEKQVNFSGDFDDFYHAIPSKLMTVASGVSHSPFGIGAAFLFSVKASFYSEKTEADARCVQTATDLSDGKTKQRAKSSTGWTSWCEVALDIPTFYKNYNSISALTNAVYGMKMQNINLSDTLNIADVGCYITTSNCENAPVTGGHAYYIIALMSNTIGERFCIAFDASSAHIYYGFLKTGVSVSWIQAV